MLIGGPNQSYNVNFKELPRIEGKDFHQAIFKIARQLLFKLFSKNTKNERTKIDFQETSPITESASWSSGGTPKMEIKEQ